MSFLYPSFLFALFAISIPIIIHFFNFRSYKTVYFSNTTFLKNIKSQTRSKSTLKHLLILLMRILTVAALVFAFSKPFIPVNNKTTNNIDAVVGIYIDNSFSTQSEGKYGKIIDVEKNRALNIIEAYPENQKFLYLNNNFKPKYAKPISKEQLKDFIIETEISPETKDLTQIISRYKTLLSKQKSSIYLISDFQKSTANIGDFESDTALNIVLIPAQSNTSNNLILDSAWFQTPNRPLNQTDEIYVSITNNSDQDFLDVPLNLYINDSLKAPAGFSIEANKSIIKKISFINTATGSIHGKLQITDYPVIFDNDFYFSFNISHKKNILIIDSNPDSKYLEAVFSDDNFFETNIENISTLKISEIAKHDVVFVNNISEISEGLSYELTNFCKSGGTLILLPQITTEITAINEFLNEMAVDYIAGTDSSKVYLDKINFKADVFNNVFESTQDNIEMPYLTKHILFSDNSFTDREILLFSEKNEKILSKYKVGKGNFYLFAQPASEKSGNLVFHPIWAPLIYNIALFSNTPEKNFYIIGDNSPITFSNKNSKIQESGNYHIKHITKNFDFIPQTSNVSSENIKLFINNNILEAGNYIVTKNNIEISSLAFNYNRKESLLAQHSIDELLEFEQNNKSISLINEQDKFLASTIKENEKGLQLWKYFIWAVLLFILLEILIIRLVK